MTGGRYCRIVGLDEQEKAKNRKDRVKVRQVVLQKRGIDAIESEVRRVRVLCCSTCASEDHERGLPPPRTTPQLSKLKALKRAGEIDNHGEGRMRVVRSLGRVVPVNDAHAGRDGAPLVYA